jgi:transcriptional regulator with XRE-family HTH domain
MSHIVDVYVGKRLRHCRLLRGLTQTQLAEKIGVSCQQVQKYERGKNRISASRLWMISLTLGVPISFFFDGVPGTQAHLDC